MQNVVIAKIDTMLGGVARVMTEVLRHRTTDDWVEAPIYAIVDRDTGRIVDNGYDSFEVASKAWPEAVNSYYNPRNVHRPSPRKFRR